MAKVIWKHGTRRTWGGGQEKCLKRDKHLNLKDELCVAAQLDGSGVGVGRRFERTFQMHNPSGSSTKPDGF